jgi:hypothetical protein
VGRLTLSEGSSEAFPEERGPVSAAISTAVAPRWGVRAARWAARRAVGRSSGARVPAGSGWGDGAARRWSVAVRRHRLNPAPIDSILPADGEARWLPASRCRPGDVSHIGGLRRFVGTELFTRTSRVLPGGRNGDHRDGRLASRGATTRLRASRASAWTETGAVASITCARSISRRLMTTSPESIGGG